MGFPIRKSPDHSLLAASRSLSQLTTSFFAFLRLGIHTHALSSLTITSTSHTQNRQPSSHRTANFFERYILWHFLCGNLPLLWLEEGQDRLVLKPVKYSIVKDQMPSTALKTPKIIVRIQSDTITFGFFAFTVAAFFATPCGL